MGRERGPVWTGCVLVCRLPSVLCLPFSFAPLPSFISRACVSYPEKKSDGVGYWPLSLAEWERVVRFVFALIALEHHEFGSRQLPATLEGLLMVPTSSRRRVCGQGEWFRLLSCPFEPFGDESLNRHFWCAVIRNSARLRTWCYSMLAHQEVLRLHAETWQLLEGQNCRADRSSVAEEGDQDSCAIDAKRYTEFLTSIVRLLDFRELCTAIDEPKEKTG